MHPFTDHPYARAGHTLVTVIKEIVAKESKDGTSSTSKSSSPFGRRRRLLMTDSKLPEIEGDDGASEIFAMDGPQNVEKVNHHDYTEIDQISNRRPTSVADEFLFLFGGMSERGLGASSTKGGLGPDPEYPKD